jgi:hypothetical protein
MTAFERSREKKIAPASCQKLGHQRRVLRTAVLMAGKSASAAEVVKAGWWRKIDLAPGSLDIQALCGNLARTSQAWDMSGSVRPHWTTGQNSQP